MTDLTGRKLILCLDFDGVCHMYTSGWKGAAVIPDEPVPGLFKFLCDTVDVFEVNIFSSRSNQEGGIQAMKDWFVAHLPQHALWHIMNNLRFPTEKPPAFIGIDDRVLTFAGVWPSVEELQNFKPWNKKEV